MERTEKGKPKTKKRVGFYECEASVQWFRKEEILLVVLGSHSAEEWGEDRQRQKSRREGREGNAL